MQKRNLGNSNLEVSAPGLGYMEMRLGYGPAGEKQETISLSFGRSLNAASRSEANEGEGA